MLMIPIIYFYIVGAIMILFSIFVLSYVAIKHVFNKEVKNNGDRNNN